MSFPRSFIGTLSISACSGLLLGLCYPGWNVEWLVWVWAWPLLWQIWSEHQTARRPFFSGYAAGLAFFLFNLSWIRHSARVSIAGALDASWAGWAAELTGSGAVLALSGYLALFFGLWAWLCARFFRPDVRLIREGGWWQSSLASLSSAATAACLWAGLELLRGTLLTGFGWNGLGVALHRNVVLIQIADCTGVTGLSALPIFVSCVVWNTVVRLAGGWKARRRLVARLDFTTAMVVILATALYGWRHLAPVESEDDLRLRVALLQPNVPQAVKWSHQEDDQTYRRLFDLTRLYAEARDGASPVDLVIWPESALPFDLFGHPDHPLFFNDLLGFGDFSLLTGVDVMEPTGASYTGAALFHGNFEERQDYHKIHLVPFGEYVPLRHTLPFMDSLLGGILPGDFDAGDRTEPLQLARPSLQIIPLICFEDTVGSLARQFVRQGPQVIVNMTNDGWFLHSIQPEQHLANAKFRAIELRRPMLRAANTGVTCVIDDRGRILQRLEDPETHSHFIEGVLPATLGIAAAPPLTLYARWGDWFSWASLAIAALAIIWRIWARRSRAQP